MSSSFTSTSEARHYRFEAVDDVDVFYREAGPKDAPAILLLHGFPTSSAMYHNLIPALAEKYHVIAPDLPGFGFTKAPPRGEYNYTFDNLAKTIDGFTAKIRLDTFAIQIFDYGAPVGLRLCGLASGPRHRDRQPKRQCL